MESKVISPETLRHVIMQSNIKAPVLGQHPSGLIPVYKKYGETPLECLTRLRLKFPALERVTLSYAGRLDPLAEGLMLILVGKEFNRDRKTYLKLDKEYELEILFGISTDTGDILGIPKQSDIRKGAINADIVRQIIPSLIGKQLFHYPAFSSRTVKGKPLFAWTKENKLSDIVIPTAEIHLRKISMYATNEVPASTLADQIKKAVALVNGDFRQTEILAAWSNLFSKQVSQSDKFFTCSLKVTCSSGSYMRTLAEEIGKRLGVPALAYSIRRIKMGDMGVEQAYIVD